MDNDKELERSHPCPTCTKMFKRPSDLKNHINAHLRNDGVVYTCPKCDRKFKAKRSRNLHFYSVHQDDDKLLESVQRQSFVAKKNINQETYKCPDCENTYNLHNSLYVHCRIKHKGVDWVPKKPGKKPGSSRTTSGELKCLKCGNTFVSKQWLKSHLNKVHGRAHTEINGLDVNEMPKISEQSTSPPKLQTQSSFAFRAEECNAETLHHILPSAGLSSDDAGTCNRYISYPQITDYSPKQASYTPSLSWHHNEETEHAKRRIPSDSPVRPWELTFQEQSQICQPSLQVYPHITEHYSSWPSVQEIHASQTAYHPGNGQSMPMTSAGSMDTNIRGYEILEQNYSSFASTNVQSDPWYDAYKGLQYFDRNSLSYGSN